MDNIYAPFVQITENIPEEDKKLQADQQIIILQYKRYRFTVSPGLFISNVITTEFYDLAIHFKLKSQLEKIKPQLTEYFGDLW